MWHRSGFGPSPLIAQQSSLFSDHPISISPALTNLQLSPVLPIDSDLSDVEVDESEDTSEIPLPPVEQIYQVKSVSAPKPANGGTNLVAKEVVVASSLITSVVSPSLPSLMQSASVSPLQLIVLGVPTTGAKSRVETQIKIQLVLVRPKHHGQGEEEIACDGGLEEGVGSRVERIGTWSHVKLPKFLALRQQKSKKSTKNGACFLLTLFISTDPYSNDDLRSNTG